MTVLAQRNAGEAGIAAVNCLADVLTQPLIFREQGSGSLRYPNWRLKEKHGNTALLYITKQSHAEVVQLLIAHGTNTPTDAGTDSGIRPRRFFSRLV